MRWTDALIGGGVALVAATVVPGGAAAAAARAGGRRGRARSPACCGRAAEVMVDGEAEPALDLLADARSTDHLIRELQDAADEGMAVVASSPFRVRHQGNLRRMAELVDPLDRALRSTRVLVRQTAVAAYHRRPVPPSYAVLCTDLAAAADVVAAELADNRMAAEARDAAARGRRRDRAGRAHRGAVRRGGARPDPVGGRRPAAAHRARPARVDRRAAATAAMSDG